MGSKSDTWEYDVLKMVTGQAPTSLTVPTPITPYIGLFTATPSDAGGGTECTVANGYARVSAVGKFGPPSGSGVTASQVANSSIIAFNTATPLDWMSGANIVAFGIFTASAAGTLLMWGALTTPRAVLAGDTASFAIGALVLTED